MMKKLYVIIAISAMSIGLAFANPCPIDGNETERNGNFPCSQTELVANQNLVTGTVAVYLRDNTLEVQYKAAKNWKLTETQLYVGTLENLPTQANGNPDLNAFPHGRTHANGTKIASYDINLADISNGKVIIAAYSKVKGIVTKTAWAGTIDLEGATEGSYYEFDVTSCGQ